MLKIRDQKKEQPSLKSQKAIIWKLAKKSFLSEQIQVNLIKKS